MSNDIIDKSLLLLSVLSETPEEPHSGWISWIHEVMHVTSVLIGVIGVAIVVWGVLCGFLLLVRLEYDVLSGRNFPAKREALKEHLGFYLLLGLEFLIAADIIDTLIAPTLGHLINLGLIIVIRTIISVSLNWELSHKGKKET